MRRIKTSCLLGIVASLSGLLLGQTASQRGLALSQDNLSFVPPLQGKMRWTGNHLAGCDYCASNHPLVWVVDRQGNRVSVALEIPDAGYVGVRDVASGQDGSLTTVGLAMSADSRMATFIGWISPDATRQVVTRVWPYDPEVVAVSADGTIWTVGAMLNDNHTVVYPNVLRHYTPSGQLLASTIVSGVRKNSGGLYNVSSTSALMASDDRVGWLTMTCQYIEFSLEAVQLGSYACPNGYVHNFDVNVALSSANDLLVGGTPAKFPPMELDRATSTWKLVPAPSNLVSPQMLLGFDGLTLVTSTASNTTSWMRRYIWTGWPAPGNQ